MKLKPDLIRDLLFYSESLGNHKESETTVFFNHPFLSHYSWGELFSAISILGSDDANLFDGVIVLALGGSQISHIGPLTPKGLAYLELFRDNQRWVEIKKKTGLPPGSITLEALYQLAKNIS